MKFWSKFRTFQTHSLRRHPKISDEDIEFTLAPISERQDPKFRQALEIERQGLVDRIEQSSKPIKVAQNSTTVPAPWQPFSSGHKAGSVPGPKVANTSSNVKIKRRNESLIDNSLVPDPRPPSPDGSEEEPIESSLFPVQVKQQTYSILMSMFSSSDTAAATKKAINWDAFVNAMTDVGFCARHGAGSAVTFEVSYSFIQFST